ncbi:zinc metalloproteinase nas-4-like [Chironomus tepperi]|uniref:zinc metalloproteinase nas-4-like n=1 Tax=Chironomus tepperi TaxID=113505 RepID=UPI00391EFCD1
MSTHILCYFCVVCALVHCIRAQKVEDEDVIDLSHLGSKLFRNPDYEFSKDLNADHPEEQGPYLQGDLLIPTGNAKNGMKSETYRWKNGEIPYVIRGRFSSSEMSLIKNAFNQYHKNTCLKFTARRSGQTDYIAIDNSQSGCWSSVGRVGGEQIVNLQSPGCVTKTGTVIHELLHAAGFLHEQNREERDQFVSIIDANVRTGYEVNFKKASTGETTGFGIGYDYGSVMHYSTKAFSKNGQPTIKAKQTTTEQMGQREGFSKKDIEKINKMYKCTKTTAESDPSLP